MMVIENEYEIGQTVYLKTDPGQLPRMITSIEVFKQGEILYSINSGNMPSKHYAFELSHEKNIIDV